MNGRGSADERVLVDKSRYEALLDVAEAARAWDRERFGEDRKTYVKAKSRLHAALARLSGEETSR